MENDPSNQSGFQRDHVHGGIGVFSALGIVFVVLKLCVVIDWSWWWVLAPFWGPLAVSVAVLLAVSFFASQSVFGQKWVAARAGPLVERPEDAVCKPVPLLSRRAFRPRK